MKSVVNNRHSSGDPLPTDSASGFPYAAYDAHHGQAGYGTDPYGQHGDHPAHSAYDGHSTGTFDSLALSYGDDDPLFGSLPGRPAGGNSGGNTDMYGAPSPYDTGAQPMVSVPSQPGPPQPDFGYAADPWGGSALADTGSFAAGTAFAAGAPDTGQWDTSAWAQDTAAYAYDTTAVQQPGHDPYAAPGTAAPDGLGGHDGGDALGGPAEAYDWSTGLDPYDAYAPYSPYPAPEQAAGHPEQEYGAHEQGYGGHEEYGTAAEFAADQGYGSEPDYGTETDYGTEPEYGTGQPADAGLDDVTGPAATAALPVVGEPGADGGGEPFPETAVAAGPPAPRGDRPRSRRRAPRTRRSALLTVAVPSVAVMGVAGAAAATVMDGGQSGGEETTTLAAADEGAPVQPSAANKKIDSQIAGLSAADDFADRANRTQERIDLKKRQEAERKRKAAEAAKREAERPKFALPVKQHGLSAGYGQAGVNWMSVHTGIDFPVSYGTPVMAATDGTVTTKWDVAYGNMAIVTASDGTQTWYCHLSSTKIRAGQVKAGDTIAYSGNSGNSTGPHLHFEVRPGGGSAVDPLPWLRGHGLDPT